MKLTLTKEQKSLQSHLRIAWYNGSIFRGRNLSPTHRYIYWYFLKHAFPRSLSIHAPFVWSTTHEEIAAWCNCSVSTVYRAIQVLVAAELISYKKRGRKGTMSIYQVNMHPTQISAGQNECSAGQNECSAGQNECSAGQIDVLSICTTECTTKCTISGEGEKNTLGKNSEVCESVLPKTNNQGESLLSNPGETSQDIIKYDLPLPNTREQIFKRWSNGKGIALFPPRAEGGSNL